MAKIIFAALALMYLSSCYPKHEWKRDTIISKEKQLLEAAKTGKVDTGQVSKLLASYEDYAKIYPGDSTGAEFLFKEADFYRYLRKPQRSVEIYKRIYEGYPNYAKRPYALFLQGFINENEVGNMEAAREKYNEFLSAYPNHPISKDAKNALANLGKTPEQLMKEFEQKQKEDSLQSARR